MPAPPLRLPPPRSRTLIPPLCTVVGAAPCHGPLTLPSDPGADPGSRNNYYQCRISSGRSPNPAAAGAGPYCRPPGINFLNYRRDLEPCAVDQEFARC